MIDCPYCGTQVDDKYNFCLNCSRQIRCVSCKEALLPDKAMCFVCGQALVIQVAPQAQMNEFTLEETQTETSSSRSMTGRFSDQAIGHAVAFLGGLQPHRPITQTPAIRKFPQQVLPPPITEEQFIPVADESVSVDSETFVHTSVHSYKPVDDALSKAVAFFTPDGDGMLVSLVSDFKGETKGEQQKRYMLLYTHAHNRHYNKAMPSRSHLFKAMNANKIHDRNCYSYFDDISARFLVKTEAGYIVNHSGAEEIERLVLEIDDKSKKGLQEWAKINKSRAPRSQISKSDAEQIKKWVDMVPELGFDIRNLKTLSNYALFGLWLITRKLGVAQAVKSGMVYNILKIKYTSIPGDSQSYNKVFRRAYIVPFVQRTGDGLIYLTLEGQKRVEGWVQGEAVPDTPDIEDEQDNDDAEEIEEE